LVRIQAIESGSIAEALELEIGTRIVRINGQTVRDGLDLTFLLSDTELELEAVDTHGESTVYEIERDPSEPVGIIPAPDTIRECANACVFCFIDGNPKDVRSTLWLRDDDFRLSFTYGSYVTLTNLGPRGMDRLVEQRISPLYVSVHTTDPHVRVRLLKNERAGLIMEQLRYLLDHGLEVHTQIVLCPEWNDRQHLDRTLRELWELGGGIRSLSVVPVGLTRYNVNRPVRPMEPHEAADAIRQVEGIRQRALAERGIGWAYAADELFLLAGETIPGEEYYDDGALTENGVGAVRRFIDDFDARIRRLPRLPGRRVRIVTGRSMAPLFQERADAVAAGTGAEVEVLRVVNDFYGELVSVAGLLSGRDMLRAVREAGEPRAGDIILLPGEALNADDLFIDSLSLEAMVEALAPARVVPAFDVVDALRSVAREAR
jgi:putative radical SAM enzyme (TIGR03279 family)